MKKIKKFMDLEEILNIVKKKLKNIKCRKTLLVTN